MITGIPAQEKSVLQSLQEATSELHQQLEAEFSRLYDSLSLAEYVRLLETLTGYYAPIEVSLSEIHARFMLTKDFPLRLKTPLLLKDLEVLEPIGFSLAGLPVCANFPEIPSWPQAFGVLYALESITMGSYKASKALANKLFLTPASGLAFFYGYGEKTGTLWNTLGDTLIERANSPEIESMMIKAARETFMTFGNWLKESGL